MDDLKFLPRNDSEQESLLKTVKCFSDDNGMECGLYKCAKATILRESLQQTSSISLGSEVTIKDLELEEDYMYLGVKESEGIHYKNERNIA